jgi:hypothetical protein
VVTDGLRPRVLLEHIGLVQRVLLVAADEGGPLVLVVGGLHLIAAGDQQGGVAAEKAHLTQITAKTAGDYITDIQQAVHGKPDLIISVGDGFVDPLALVTASNLRTQFLVVGAETAEPTDNVTAADWAGASFRGEGLGRSSASDPKSFTSERAGRAVRAGVAAVLSGLTGIVVWLS